MNPLLQFSRSRSNFFKEAAINTGNLFGNFFLIVLAITLFIPLFVIAVHWKIYVSLTRDNRKAREIMSGTGKFFEAITITIDQLGNVAFGGMFSDLLVVDPTLFPFGRTHETISEVLGWNEYLDNLSRTGKFIVALVNFCDFTQNEHCANAMASGLSEAQYKVNYYKKMLTEVETIQRTKEFIAKYN